jgi:hypothetical protein
MSGRMVTISCDGCDTKIKRRLVELKYCAEKRLSSHVFCSLACCGKSRQNRIEKTCGECGGVFQASTAPTKKNSKYCGLKCRIIGNTKFLLQWAAKKILPEKTLPVITKKEVPLHLPVKRPLYSVPTQVEQMREELTSYRENRMPPLECSISAITNWLRKECCVDGDVDSDLFEEARERAFQYWGRKKTLLAIPK